MTPHRDLKDKPFACADCAAPLLLRVPHHGRFSGAALCEACVRARACAVVALRDAPPDPAPPAYTRAGTSCYYGHDLTPETIYVNRAGREECRACRTLSMARYNARQRLLARGTSPRTPLMR